jgi:hypothetical protein
METITSLLALLAGLFVRLAIPMTVTFVLIYFLRKLDLRWQVEAQLPVSIENPKCWKIKNCPPEQVANCAAAISPLPCWQAYRLPNGYLREDCLSCEVFINAPAPAFVIDPRRM